MKDFGNYQEILTNHLSCALEILGLKICFHAIMLRSIPQTQLESVLGRTKYRILNEFHLILIKTI